MKALSDTSPISSSPFVMSNTMFQKGGGSLLGDFFADIEEGLMGVCVSSIVTTIII